MKEGPRPVKTTKTSMQIVEAIKQRNGATLTEIAGEINIAKSTVHNHLNTLLNQGYLVREGDVYHVGLKLLELGEHARTRRSIYEHAQEEVYTLASATNEEADFTVEENGRVYTLEYALGNTDVTTPQTGSDFLQRGSSFYTHNCASGKAILATFPDHKIEKIINKCGLPATTEKTITDKNKFLTEIKETKQRGYAINDEELQEGYRAVAMAVQDSDETTFGALCVGGPTYRFEIEGPRFEQIISQLLQRKERLEEKIQNSVE